MSPAGVRHARRALYVCVAVLVVLGGCGGSHYAPLPDPPGQARVDITPSEVKSGEQVRVTVVSTGGPVPTHGLYAYFEEDRDGVRTPLFILRAAHLGQVPIAAPFSDEYAYGDVEVRSGVTQTFLIPDVSSGQYWITRPLNSGEVSGAIRVAP